MLAVRVHGHEDVEAGLAHGEATGGLEGSALTEVDGMTRENDAEGLRGRGELARVDRGLAAVVDEKDGDAAELG